MRRNLSWIAVAFVSIAHPLAASPTTMTEDSLLALLTDSHPAVVALSDRLAAAEHAERATYVDNPRFDFFLESPDGASSQSTWSLAWKPPLDGQRGLSKKVGNAGLAAARSDLAQRKLALRATVRALYADWWRLTEMERLLAVQVESINRLAQRSNRRVERGEESGLDAGRLRFAAAEIKAALGALRAELARTRADVRVFAPGLPASAEPVRPGLPELAAQVQATTHPAVETRQHELERARLVKKRSGRYLEFPELAAGWTRLSGAEGSESDGPVIGVNWALPLFDRDQGHRARAARDVAVAEARLSWTQAETEVRMSAARDAYASLRSAALDVQDVTVDADQLIGGATSAFFDSGETSVTDLLETLRSILSGRRAAIDSYHEALSAHRQLELSVGRALTRR